jgi:hypothetical protein
MPSVSSRKYFVAVENPDSPPLDCSIADAVTSGSRPNCRANTSASADARYHAYLTC